MNLIDSNYLIIILLALNHSHALPSETSTQSNDGITYLQNHCVPQTINDIAHTLPQLCPINSWRSEVLSAESTEAAATISNSGVGATESGSSKIHDQPSSTTSQDATTTPFMSFEDWKEMMFKKAGQDPNSIKARKSQDDLAVERQRYPVEGGQEVLGDEGEISLNFESYPVEEGGKHSTYSPENEGSDEKEGSTLNEVGQPNVHRNKDAGKTCKERNSYSSFDAGATIIKVGGGGKNAKAILVENKDSYMLMECATSSKHVIVELSDDVQIDTIVLANFEFFSSMIRHFRVSVSDRYPVKAEKWRDLGVFEARNTRDIQPFLVKNPQIWAKYVRIEFLTHYGNEYYCPLSLLRIHGSRLLDSWRDSESGRDEELLEEEESYRGDTQATQLDIQPSASDQGSQPIKISQHMSPSKQHPNPFRVFEISCSIVEYNAANWSLGIHDEGSIPVATDIEEFISFSPNNTAPTLAPSDAVRSNISIDSIHDQPSTNSSNILSTKNQPTPMTQTRNISNTSATSTATNSSVSVRVGTAAPSIKNRSSSTYSAPTASPTVQEGFFYAVNKRLQHVESNLTLTLKYIEDQSKHLQDAFQSGQRKQEAKVSDILEYLNKTVLEELRAARDQYDQIWQSTTLALERQRTQSERDILALGSRLNVLADEVVFQKRMAIVQAILLLLCLSLVIFSRGVAIPYLTPTQDHSPTSSPFAEILLSMQKRELDGQRLANHSHGRVIATTKPSARSTTISATIPSVKPTNYDSNKLSDNKIPLVQSNSEDFEYQRPSPPLTPTHTIEEHETEWHSSNIMNSRNLGNQQLESGIKPLPSLPENPTSPHT